MASCELQFILDGVEELGPDGTALLTSEIKDFKLEVERLLEKNREEQEVWRVVDTVLKEPFYGADLPNNRLKAIGQALFDEFGLKAVIRRSNSTVSRENCLRRLRHAFTVLKGTEGFLGQDLIIETNFRDNFLLGVTDSFYEEVLEVLPLVVVTTFGKLKRLVKLVAEQIGNVCQRLGYSVPPWRQYDCLISKWFSGNVVDENIFVSVVPRVGHVVCTSASTNSGLWIPRRDSYMAADLRMFSCGLKGSQKTHSGDLSVNSGNGGITTVVGFAVMKAASGA